MKALLVVQLKKKGRMHGWNHVAGQIGILADMVDKLTAQYYIFLTRDQQYRLSDGGGARGHGREENYCRVVAAWD